MLFFNLLQHPIAGRSGFLGDSLSELDELLLLLLLDLFRCRRRWPLRLGLDIFGKVLWELLFQEVLGLQDILIEAQIGANLQEVLRGQLQGDWLAFHAHSPELGRLLLVRYLFQHGVS